MIFVDYIDDEFLRIFEFKINYKYNGVMDCVDGLCGFYCWIVSWCIG